MHHIPSPSRNYFFFYGITSKTTPEKQHQKFPNSETSLAVGNRCSALELVLDERLAAGEVEDVEGASGGAEGEAAGPPHLGQPPRAQEPAGGGEEAEAVVPAVGHQHVALAVHHQPSGVREAPRPVPRPTELLRADETSEEPKNVKNIEEMTWVTV